MAVALGICGTGALSAFRLAPETSVQDAGLVLIGRPTGWAHRRYSGRHFTPCFLHVIQRRLTKPLRWREFGLCTKAPVIRTYPVSVGATGLEATPRDCCTYPHKAP